MSTMYNKGLASLDALALEFNPQKFANIWRMKQDGISAIKFDAVRIHFLSDVFVAVAVFVTLAP